MQTKRPMPREPLVSSGGDDGHVEVRIERQFGRIALSIKHIPHGRGITRTLSVNLSAGEILRLRSDLDLVDASNSHGGTKQ